MKIDEIRLFEIKTIIEEEGYLSVLETFNDFQFEIKRVFYIYNTPNPVVRGKHAHIKTKQIFICLTGECKVVCDDGKSKKEFILNNPDIGLYVPEGIWADQVYHDDNNMMLVLCNTKYDDADYIKDYNQFLEWKKF